MNANFKILSTVLATSILAGLSPITHAQDTPSKKAGFVRIVNASKGWYEAKA